MNSKLDWKRIDNIIDVAVEEDIGNLDLTSSILIPNDVNVCVDIVVKQDCICCGVDIIKHVFERFNNNIVCKLNYNDGDCVTSDSVVIELMGNARVILSFERIVLNFLQRLTGISTETKKYVDLLYNSNIKILDTRKTIPGYRNLEKYAVRVGGGHNHRMGLYDSVIVKDNHFTCLRKLYETDDYSVFFDKIEKIIETYDNVEVVVEIETIEQFEKILSFNRIKRVLLDNMSCEDIKKITEINNRRKLLEVSGGVNLTNLEEISKLEIDFISVGAITHSARAVDFSLNVL